MNFRIGQEVACLNAKGWGPKGTDPGPDKGDVLRISLIMEFEGEPYLGFPEWKDSAYLASQFRPLVRTDISVFTAMLAPAPKQKEVVDG